MAPLPLLKLAAMFVKQLSKPIASRLKVEAAKNQGMSDGCASVGQVAHQISSRISILASGYRIVGVKPLPYETAVADGITVISESIMYTIAGSIIIYEYAKNESKNAKKAAQAAEQEARFRTDLEEKFAQIAVNQSDLIERIARMEAQLKEAQETPASASASAPAPAPSSNTPSPTSSSLSWLLSAFSRSDQSARPNS